MPTQCIVFGAVDAKDSGRSFHRFPVSKLITCKEWVKFIGKEGTWSPSGVERVCSDHFNRSEYKCGTSKAVLNSGAIPTIKRSPVPVRLFNEKVRVLGHNVNISNVSGPSLILPNTPMQSTQALNDLRTKLNKQEKIIAALLIQKKDLDVKISTLNNSVEDLGGQISTLKEKQINRDVLENQMKQQIHELEETVKTLRSKSDIAILKRIQDFGGSILACIVKRAIGKKGAFDFELKRFALSLLSYSPKAHNFVRSSFNKLLPNKRTVRRWLAEIEAQPGFILESLFKIKEMEIKNHSICSLVLDEIGIRNQLLLNNDGRLVGFTDYGELNHPPKRGQLASSALFVLLVAVNGAWKLPIAYFLTKGLPAQLMTEVISSSLHKVHETGAEIISIAFDGLPSNLAVFERLGADFSHLNLRTWMPHLCGNGEKVYFIPDTPHMFKLIRNLWTHPSNDGLLYDSDGNALKWSKLVDLYNVQKTEGLRAANGLTREIIYFKNQKMKVKLVTKLFSSSVSKALKMCNSIELDGFEYEDTIPLANFLDVLDRGFDCLNSRHPMEQGRKAPLSKSNSKIWKQTFQDLRACLEGLQTVEGVPILETALNTGPLGILIALKSIEAIMSELICCQEPKLTYLRTYKLNQDHLEMMFSSLRACLGFNNNPSVVQLTGCLRRILSATILPSLRGNCLPLDDTQLLSVKGLRKQFVEVVDLDLVDNVSDNSDPDDLDLETINYDTLSQFTKCVTTYIAGYIARQLMKKVHCVPCQKSLNTKNESDQCDDDYRLISLKQNGGLYYPSRSLVNICKITESVVRTLCSEDCTNVTVGEVVRVATRRCTEQMVFGQAVKVFIGCTDFLSNHTLPLAKLIIEYYTKIRLKHFVKEFTKNVKDVLVRNRNSRLTVFQGM